jgi:hypothetical protein
MTCLTDRKNQPGLNILCAIALALHLAVCSSAYAQLENRSIALVPANVDLYIGGYRILKPYRQFWNSPALTEFRGSSLATKFRDAFQQAWRERQGGLSRVRTVVENRNTQEVRRFLEDVVAEDVFLVADETLSDFLQRLATIQRKWYFLADPSVSNTQKAEIVYGWIDQLGPGLRLPNVVLAGLITDQERALAKVDEVEGLLRFGLGAIPEARPALKLLKRIDDPRGTRLQWRIPFAAAPWDAIPTNEIFDAESRDRLREVLADKALVLTFGILDGRFIVALGDTTEPISMVAPESSLLNHPDLQGVRDHPGQRITGIRYVSDRLARATFDVGLRDFFSKLANAILRPMTYDLKDSEFREWLMACIDDAGWIDSAIEAHVPEPRGSTEFSLLLDNGWEVHAHHRTVNALFRGSSPLQGMRHWGNAPWLVLDVKLADHPEYFQASRAIARRIKQRLDDLQSIPSKDLPDGRWSQVPAIADGLWPILYQGAEVWQNQMLPTMNGEHVFVLRSGGLMSHRWHPRLPPSNEPLPIPEAAWLTGIRDPDQWIDSLRGLVRVVRQAFPIAQAPERFDEGEWTTWGYPIPDDCPAPESMMPRISVGPSWSIFTDSDSLAVNVRVAHEPGIGHGQFDATKNAAKAAWIDFGSIAAMLTPWVRYAVDASRDTIESEKPITISGVEFDLALYADDLVEAWRTFERLGQMSSVTTIHADGSSYSRSIFVFSD